ncbi:hypothetical protein CHS0354_017319 [Potamilus streckersoni]|uniref:Uncharacterized protein n=1 Tax=Potamilus streckersoni TaxID=2493646 RepID=A0AAE0W6S9_9BIVA|nr:hypothetical protein CHS0354_017319 [Potamilus streckersoni]
MQLLLDVIELGDDAPLDQEVAEIDDGDTSATDAKVTMVAVFFEVVVVGANLVGVTGVLTIHSVILDVSSVRVIAVVSGVYPVYATYLSVDAFLMITIAEERCQLLKTKCIVVGEDAGVMVGASIILATDVTPLDAIVISKGTNLFIVVVSVLVPLDSMVVDVIDHGGSPAVELTFSVVSRFSDVLAVVADWLV